MSPRLPRRGALAALAAALLSLGLPAFAEERPEADVLSIGGPVTEIVAALGQQHRLKARDTTSLYPPEVQNLPDVGYLRALSPEGVLSVDPGLILAEEGAGPPEALEVIRAADLNLVEVPDALSTEGILRRIAVIGAALGVPEAARALATRVEEEMVRATAHATRPTVEKKRVLFILSTQGGRINAAGRGTAAQAIIDLAGGVNVLADFQGYRQITDEAVALAAPDVILMMDRGGDHGPDDAALFSMPAIGLTPAGRDRAVVRMDGLLLLGFGPRTAQAVMALNRALYPAEG
jgi:iron complex transport system substrate-binding protein